MLSQRLNNFNKIVRLYQTPFILPDTIVGMQIFRMIVLIIASWYEWAINRVYSAHQDACCLCSAKFWFLPHPHCPRLVQIVLAAQPRSGEGMVDDVGRGGVAVLPHGLVRLA